MGRSPEMPVPAGRPVTVWSLHELAARVGGYVWWERQLFELLGAAVIETADPTAKMLLAADSLHAAWRASQWEARLPVVHDLDSVVVAPTATAAAVAAEVAAAPVALRVAGIYAALLPALAEAYAAHAAVTSASADLPISRVLVRVRADLGADLAGAEVLVQGAGAEGLPAAAQWRDRLAEHGGIPMAPEDVLPGT